MKEQTFSECIKTTLQVQQRDKSIQIASMPPAVASPAEGLLQTGTMEGIRLAHILASNLSTAILLRPFSSEKILN